MDEPNTQETAPIAAPDSNWVTRFFKPAAYAVSALSGAITTRYLVNDAAYENLKKYGLFEDMVDTHRGRLKSATAEAIKNINSSDPQKLTDAISKEQSHFYPKFQNRMKDVGVGNVLDEWKTIHRNQRFSATAIGLSVTGVCLGASLEISRELEKRLTSKQAEL